MSNEKPFGLTARQKIQKGMTITREKIIPMEFVMKADMILLRLMLKSRI